MKVLLIPPTFHYKTEYPAFLSASDFPTGFGYLVAALKEAGHEVYGCNPNNIIGYASAKAMITDVIVKDISRVKPDMIGLGGLCTDYAFLRDAIGIIRQTVPQIPIVLGGQIVTNDAKFIFNDLKPDFAIVGEGEEALVKLADRVPSNEIGNLWYWEESVKVAKYTGQNYRYKPIDELPFPDYEPFGIQDMMDNYSMATRVLYRYPRTHPRPFMMVASRSCPFACTFCVHQHRGIPYRARSIENIQEEIRENYAKYRFNILVIDDELFAVKKERLQDFSNMVLAGKAEYGWDFDWIFQTHTSAQFDLESLTLAKKAGCYGFSYGLESASPKVLESMNKKTDPHTIAQAIEMARQVGVGFSGNFIFGDPVEDEATIAESLSFWLQKCQSCFGFLANLMPYPGSKVFDLMRERGMFPDKKQFYEKIDEVVPNMTSMHDRTWGTFLNLFKFLEQSWLFVKGARVVSVQIEEGEDDFVRAVGGFYYRITAVCPHCGKETIYRERLLVPKQPFFLGTGCVHCNAKIRVEQL